MFWFLCAKRNYKAFLSWQLSFLLQEGIPGWGGAGLEPPWLRSVPTGIKKEIWNTVLQTCTFHRNTKTCSIFFIYVWIWLIFFLCICPKHLFICCGLFQQSCDFVAFNISNFFRVFIFLWRVVSPFMWVFDYYYEETGYNSFGKSQADSR